MNISECNKKDAEMISNALSNFNAQQVAFTQSEPFIDLNYKIEIDEQVVAGILGCLYCWGCLSISILYVDKNYRGKGYGRQLLRKIESEAIKRSCHLIHLDTFDFQAKGFYLQEGYEVFAELPNCPKNHTRFYLKKEL